MNTTGKAQTEMVRTIQKRGSHYAKLTGCSLHMMGILEPTEATWDSNGVLLWGHQLQLRGQLNLVRLGPRISRHCSGQLRKANNRTGLSDAFRVSRATANLSTSASNVNMRKPQRPTHMIQPASHIVLRFLLIAPVSLKLNHLAMSSGSANPQKSRQHRTERRSPGSPLA